MEIEKVEQNKGDRKWYEGQGNAVLGRVSV